MMAALAGWDQSLLPTQGGILLPCWNNEKLIPLCIKGLLKPEEGNQQEQPVCLCVRTRLLS